MIYCEQLRSAGVNAQALECLSNAARLEKTTKKKTESCARERRNKRVFLLTGAGAEEMTAAAAAATQDQRLTRVTKDVEEN